MGSSKSKATVVPVELHPLTGLPITAPKSKWISQVSEDAESLSAQINKADAKATAADKKEALSATPTAVDKEEDLQATAPPWLDDASSGPGPDQLNAVPSSPSSGKQLTLQETKPDSSGREKARPAELVLDETPLAVDPEYTDLAVAPEILTTQKKASRSKVLPADSVPGLRCDDNRRRGKQGGMSGAAELQDSGALPQVTLKKRTRGELADVSQHGKTSLQTALVDGRLSNALRADAKLAPDLHDARAANLIPDLKQAKADAFRRWAKSKLLDSSSQGNLDAVTGLLTKLAIPPPAREPEAKAAAQATLPAASDPLADTMSSLEMKAPRGVQRAPAAYPTAAASGPRLPKNSEGRRLLRGRGRALLSDAYRDCNLEKVARAQSSLVPDIYTAKVAEFRRVARQTLLESHSDGRLETLVVALTFSYHDVQPCRALLGRKDLGFNHNQPFAALVAP